MHTALTCLGIPPLIFIGRATACWCWKADEILHEMRATRKVLQELRDHIRPVRKRSDL